MPEVRLGAFIPALILAPLVPAVPVWLLMDGGARPGEFGLPILILAVSPLLGAPTYLTFGAVMLWRAVLNDGLSVAAAFTAHILSMPLILAFFLLMGGSEGFLQSLFVILLGCLFAPLWGGLFGALYGVFTLVADPLRSRSSDP